MTPALLLMIAVGVAIGVAGGVQVARGGRAARRARASAAYRERLAGVMLVALGLILIVFAITFATVTRG